MFNLFESIYSPDQRKPKIKAMPKRYVLVFLCFCAVFVCYIDRVNISVAAISMQEQFGWSETVKGVVLSSFFIGYMIFQVPSGYLANRYGGKIILGVAVLWWSLFTILTPVAASTSLPLLIVVRIMMGLGEAAMFPSAYNLFGHWVPLTERSRAVSLLLSGAPIGTVFALATTGWLVTAHGWPSIFYVFGLAGVVWAYFWFYKAYSKPEDHPAISDSEKVILGECQPIKGGNSDVIPLHRLLSMSPVWALIINHFCSNWGIYMLLAWLPSYFKKVQGISIEYVGLYSALPWLILFLVTNIGGWIADLMIERNISVTAVRKIMQCTGLIGSAIFLLIASSAVSTSVSVFLMCGALGFLGFTWSGYASNHLDIAPRHAGILMGVTNTAGTIPGVVGVVITGWLVDVTGSYDSAFQLAAGINIMGALVWLTLSTGNKIID